MLGLKEEETDEPTAFAKTAPQQQEEKRSVDRAGRRSGRVVFVRAAETAARPLPHS